MKNQNPQQLARTAAFKAEQSGLKSVIKNDNHRSDIALKSHTTFTNISQRDRGGNYGSQGRRLVTQVQG